MGLLNSLRVLFLLFLCSFVATATFAQCEASSSTNPPNSLAFKLLRTLVIESTRKAYTSSDPFIGSPNCVNSPLTPLPPSTTPLTPTFPIQPPPLPPLTPFTTPPTPTIYIEPPPPPAYIAPILPPSPPETLPNPPFYEPSPPETLPNPPFYEPSPPSYIPSPPSYVPSPIGYVPAPPTFLPPIVYPPPTVPPPPFITGPSKLWCVAKPTVPDPILQEAMDFACGYGANCIPIQPSGLCYQPNTVIAHASYAFNNYWHRMKASGGTCDFGETGMLVTVDPSYDGCNFDIY